MDINKIIEQKQITKYRLAKESGVPHATLNDICSGKTNIGKCSAETLYKIAKVLDVSMESLLSDNLYEREIKRELEEEMLSKMTKYDRKQYLKEKQRLKEKRTAKITKVLSSIGALCFCGFVGFAIYVASLPYMVVGGKYNIEKDEVNFYYSRNVENFLNIS